MHPIKTSIISVVLYGSQGNDDFHYTNYFTDFYSSFNGGKSNKALYSSFGSPQLKGNPTLPIETDTKYAWVRLRYQLLLCREWLIPEMPCGTIRI